MRNNNRQQVKKSQTSFGANKKKDHGKEHEGYKLRKHKSITESETKLRPSF